MPLQPALDRFSYLGFSHQKSSGVTHEQMPAGVALPSPADAAEIITSRYFIEYHLGSWAGAIQRTEIGAIVTHHFLTIDKF